MSPRILIPALAVAVLSACSGAGAEVETTTTAPPTTTTITLPPTTTTLVGAQTAIEGAPDELRELVGEFYDWALGVGEAPTRVATTLLEGLEDLDPDVETLAVTGVAHTASVLETEIAVIVAGEDVLLAVNDGTWRIAGAKLASLGAPAIYGTSPRLLFVIGSDARPGENPLKFRADSLHIVSAVPESGEGAIVGIPRDSWVDRPDGGKAKFTNVMASRGPEVIVETAELLTGLDFEGYVVTGFKGFVELVDAFGGFVVDIPYAMAEPKSKAYFDAGEQHLGGGEALAFARNRTIPGGDLTRQLHHGVIMKAAMAEVQARGIEMLPALLEILTEHTWTDLSAEDLLTMAATAYELDPVELTNLVVPGSVGWAGSASVVFLEDGAFEIFEDLQDGLVTAPAEGS
jgi:LCP family protein required for cell wall assembly